MNVMQSSLRCVSHPMLRSAFGIWHNGPSRTLLRDSLTGLKELKAVGKPLMSTTTNNRMKGSTPSVIDCSGMDQSTCLMEWLMCNGADLGGVKIEKSAISGLGVVAKEDFAENEVVLQIPMQSALMVYSFDKEQDVQIPSKDLSDTAIRLALRLLNETRLGRESPWFPYIDALPKELTNPEKMDSSLVHPHTGSKTFPIILENYKKTISFLVSCGTSEEEAGWALAVVQSRAFGNGMGQEILVPLLDSMNHGDNIVDGVFSEEYEANIVYGWQKMGDTDAPKDWSIVVKSRRAISEGEELLLSYGDHENEYFYLYYGFVPMFNSRDDLVIFESLNDAFNWYCTTYPERTNFTEGEKRELLAEVSTQGEVGEIIKMNICADGSVSPIMLNFLAMLFDGNTEQAEIAIARACFDNLRKLPNFLDDLEALSATFDGELNVFEYYLATYKRSIPLFLKSLELSVEEMCDAHSSKNELQRGSPRWWFTVHEALKKLIAWDFILEIEPSRAALGL